LADGALLEHQRRPPVRPKRAAIIALYTSPPAAVTVVCADELGPVIPRTYPPPPGWSTDGHRIKAPLEYGRGREKTWVYGALRPGDGRAITLTAPSRDSAGYQQLLATVEADNPTGEVAVITDNLSSHASFSTRTWLADHPRIRQVFIPIGASLAGQSFADAKEITLATEVATCQLNARARPWVWGRPPPSPRYRRHVLTTKFKEHSTRRWGAPGSPSRCRRGR
jgi:DDE superfamily endonuclease